LRALRGAGYATAVLSNGSPAMLADAVAAAKLEGLFDAVLSVDPLRVFKTDPRVYQYALDRLGLTASEVAFLSSNGWDAHAASDFGLSVVWCNRYRQPRERLPGAPDFEIHSLAELPPLLGIG
jgi:2-haloacid dehalogenase